MHLKFAQGKKNEEEGDVAVIFKGAPVCLLVLVFWPTLLKINAETAPEGG